MNPLDYITWKECIYDLWINICIKETIKMVFEEYRQSLAFQCSQFLILKVYANIFIISIYPISYLWIELEYIEDHLSFLYVLDTFSIFIDANVQITYAHYLKKNKHTILNQQLKLPKSVLTCCSMYIHYCKLQLHERTAHTPYGSCLNRNKIFSYLNKQPEVSPVRRSSTTIVHRLFYVLWVFLTSLMELGLLAHENCSRVHYGENI